MSPAASVRSVEMELQSVAPKGATSQGPDGLAALAAINSSGPEEPKRVPQPEPLGDGRYKLTEVAGYQHTGFAFPTWKKWSILTSIFIVQLSMNWNAAIYGSAISGLKQEFGVDDALVRIGQMVFLVAYAFGCELWAPWSEELGRKWVLQGSLFLVNLFQIGCALAPNFSAVIVFRGLGGLSSAGGSVTLGMVADMWEPQEHQFAVAYVVLSSVLGSVIAPIAGGFINHYLTWQWVFWISLIFGVFAQFLHFWVPETRSDIMLDRAAQKMRKSGEREDIYGPMELRGTFRERISIKEALLTTWLPFKFLISEPIVTFLSLLSGFSDALIFIGLDAFPLVLSKWNFSVIAVGLSFIPLAIGYFMAYGMFLPQYMHDIKVIKDPLRVFKPEHRLKLLLFLVVLEPIGLFMLGAFGVGPPQDHWIGPMFAILLIGIANFAIYMATIDYMVAAYGPRAASATGGNGFCRDFLAGIAALYTRPFYNNISPGTKWQLIAPTLILGVIAVLLCIPVYVFYVWGEWFRKRSPYAKELENKRAETQEAREEAVRESKSGTRSATRSATRVASRIQSRRASIEEIRASPDEHEIEEAPLTPNVTQNEEAVFHA